jgi:hypothetical protein
MKAPINFAQKIKNYQLNAGFVDYQLGDVYGADDTMWVIPIIGGVNAIKIDFNWERNTYTIKVAKRGDGSNFHVIVEPQEFHPSSFKSFDAFLELLQTKLTTDWFTYFGY